MVRLPVSMYLRPPALVLPLVLDGARCFPDGSFARLHVLAPSSTRPPAGPRRRQMFPRWFVCPSPCTCALQHSSSRWSSTAPDVSQMVRLPVSMYLRPPALVLPLVLDG